MSGHVSVQVALSVRYVKSRHSVPSGRSDCLKLKQTVKLQTLNSCTYTLTRSLVPSTELGVLKPNDSLKLQSITCVGSLGSFILKSSTLQLGGGVEWVDGVYGPTWVVNYRLHILFAVPPSISLLEAMPKALGLG